MLGLTKKVYPSIKKKQYIYIVSCDSNSLTNNELFKNYQEVFSMDDDNSIFKKELVKIMF